jgi:hypothetical protein
MQKLRENSVLEYLLRIFRAHNFVRCCVFWNLFTEKKTIFIEWQSLTSGHQ